MGLYSKRLQKTKNVIQTSVTHSIVPHKPLWCSHHISMLSLICYPTDTQQHTIYLMIQKKMVNLINIKVNFCLFIQEWAKQIYLKCSELWEKDNRRITRKRLAWNLTKLRVWDITQWIHNFLLELTKFLPFPIWPCHMALTYTTPQINIICPIYTFYGFILGGIPRGCQNIFCLYFHANFDFIKYNTIENNYSNIVLECNVQFITG